MHTSAFPLRTPTWRLHENTGKGVKRKSTVAFHLLIGPVKKRKIPLFSTDLVILSIHSSST